MGKTSRSVCCTLLIALGAPSVLCSQVPVGDQSERSAVASPRTVVVMLGTGNPGPNPARSGPSVAIVADDRAYLVDCGPGVVRRMAAAFLDRGMQALRPNRPHRLFLTHLHSDHTLGCADLLLTPWVMGRKRPLEVWGPDGTERMFFHLTEAYREDIAIRTEGGAGANDSGHRARVTEIEPGIVYSDEIMTVRVLRVPHDRWKHAFAYRFDTLDRSIVISGDTGPSRELAALCDGCDVLVHEAVSPKWIALQPEHRRQYHRTAHTTTAQLAEIARLARPKLLVLYHISGKPVPAEAVLEEVRALYGGPVVLGQDLDVY